MLVLLFSSCLDRGSCCCWRCLNRGDDPDADADQGEDSCRDDRGLLASRLRSQSFMLGVVIVVVDGVNEDKVVVCVEVERGGSGLLVLDLLPLVVEVEVSI